MTEQRRHVQRDDSGEAVAWAGPWILNADGHWEASIVAAGNVIHGIVECYPMQSDIESGIFFNPTEAAFAVMLALFREAPTVSAIPEPAMGMRVWDPRAHLEAAAKAEGRS